MLLALCMDQTAYELVKALNWPSFVPIALDDLLTPEIASVRQRTSHGQFCWVCQPLICEYILEKYGADMVTYLESDSMFFSDPEVLFDEMQDKSVTLVPHNYSPNLDNSETAGTYCVQFNAFRNSAAAREVLRYWKEWCFKYDKSAPVAYPGQTCLDDWPDRFDCVAIIENPGAGVAPWNVNGRTFRSEAYGPSVDGRPVVFFHYHQYGRFKNGDHELGRYPLNADVLDIFYIPYVSALRKAESQVASVDSAFSHRREFPDTPTLLGALQSMNLRKIMELVRVMGRRWRGRFNVFPDSRFD